jgi:hypothetical protein
MVFSADRLIGVYESVSATYQGKQPMAEHVLVSLDLKGDAVGNQKRYMGSAGSHATRGGDVCLQ